MNVKMMIAIAVSTIIVLIVLWYFLFSYNKEVQDIVSMLRLPITEEQILRQVRRTLPDNSVALVLYIDHKISTEGSASLDLVRLEGARLYDDLMSLIKENSMSTEEATIRVSHTELSKREGLFSRTYMTVTVYIITGNCENTIIYSRIPEGVVLPRDYSIVV